MVLLTACTSHCGFALIAELRLGTAKLPLAPLVISKPPLISRVPVGHEAVASPT